MILFSFNNNFEINMKIIQHLVFISFNIEILFNLKGFQDIINNQVLFYLFLVNYNTQVENG